MANSISSSKSLPLSPLRPRVPSIKIDEERKHGVPATQSFTNKSARLYGWLITCLGAFFYVVAAFRFDRHTLDLRFTVIAFLTLFVSSRIVITFPRYSSQLSVSDTFIFLTLLLYGAPAAILLAATEALLSSFRFSRKPSTILFNWGCAACSAAFTATVIATSFGEIRSLNLSAVSLTFVLSVLLMALAQYGSNSGLVAILGALRANKTVWQIWRQYYLWTFVTYLAGASAATIIARLSDHVGFYALIFSLPIIGIVFLTYRTYVKNIEAAASQAEQAENHIRELSHYISEQERIQEQFTQIEKLSALGELASGVAHDFNNTLAGILGRAQLLLRTNDPEKIARGLRIIIKTAEDGAQTVKRIQDFARQRRDHDFEAVSVAQILSDVSEITRPRWKDQAEASNVHINMKLEMQTESNVLGDESELRDVLVNMVFNAVDAMPQGGTITLAAEEIQDRVIISVADTGCGMSNDVRLRIFDPFFTTKGKAGMGLGLAVSFGIIRRHDGTIAVETAEEQGTVFRISLPLADLDDDAASLLNDDPEKTTAVASHRSLESGARILVVEDEECVRELLKDILESEGCRVSLAGDGYEALALFDATEFHAVFTDVGMPGMSGWELAQMIRQKSEIPIAVITGWGEAVGSNEQKEAGVNWVVTKPFSASRIAELAHEIDLTYRGTEAPVLSIVAA
jgi:signal transduction histidine kinase/ActR/RegA family two-component response regulator